MVYAMKFNPFRSPPQTKPGDHALHDNPDVLPDVLRDAFCAMLLW
jgi:hypothetical protein